MDTPTRGRLAAYGRQLIDIHDHLRDRLAGLRDRIGAPTAEPRSLPEHCAAFCAALTGHHTAEDGTAFPLLAGVHPDLRPVLDELRRDHDIVAGLLRRLNELLTDPAAVPPDVLRAEFDGLAAILESHFTYEERKLVAALDALEPGDDILGTPAT
jgi:iron-sulfur cluster repair protein YtfE (RIC family)